VANKIVINTEINTKPIKDGVKEIEKEVDKVNSSDSTTDAAKNQEDAIDSVIRKTKERGAEERKQADEASRAAANREAELKRQIELQNELNNGSKQTSQPQTNPTLKPEIPGDINGESSAFTQLGDDAVVTNKKIVDLVDRLKELKYRKKELEETGYSFGFKDYEDIMREIPELEQELNRYKDTVLKNVKGASDKASQSIKKMGDSAKKSRSGFVGGIKTLLKYSLSIRSLYALINKLRSALVEGFKNLAQFNNGVNPTNTALSNLKSALTQLKNSLAVAFAPILTVVEPILTRLISLLSNAMNYVGQFFAALTGASTFTKAIKVQENYAKSLNGTASAAKKAKGQLYAFDELNVKSSADTSSSGGAGTVSPNQMFETAPIESNIAGLAERVQAIIAPIRESLQTWFSNVNFQPLIDSFEQLKTAAQPLVDNIGSGLLWVFQNVLEPLGSFVIEDALPSFFNLLATAIDAVNTTLEVLQPSFQYLWDNILTPIAQFLGETFIAVIDILKEQITNFKDMINEHSDQINNILQAVMFVIGIVVQKVKQEINVILAVIRPFLKMVMKIIGDIIDVLSGLIDFIVGVFTGDWEKAWDGIKDVFKGVWNGIMDLTEGFINMIVDALNTISIDIPDWVPEIGGTTWGFDLPHLSLPHLASGTVVPRQSSEFAAILGDNNRETEVVSPLSTMKQAMIEALSESGFNGGGNVYISADGDMDALIRLLKFKIDKENSRVGRNFDKAVTV